MYLHRHVHTQPWEYIDSAVTYRMLLKCEMVRHEPVCVAWPVRCLASYGYLPSRRWTVGLSDNLLSKVYFNSYSWILCFDAVGWAATWSSVRCVSWCCRQYWCVSVCLLAAWSKNVQIAHFVQEGWASVFKVKIERSKSRAMFVAPPLFEVPYLPNPCEYLHNPYIAKNRIHRTTFPLLTVWVYLHSFSCCGVPNTRNNAKFRENSSLQQFKVIQGHRSWCQSKAHMWLPISDQ